MDQTGQARIDARSERQAMDWALVLASQGIDAVIQGPDEPTGRPWGLQVAEADLARARQSIFLYRRENRRWPWRRKVLRGTVWFDWGCVGWVILLGFFYWLSMANPALRTQGMMNSTAVFSGEVWRLFTAIWLHADLRHLAGNAAIGLVLAGLTLGRYGTGFGLLFACACGAGGNLFSGLLSGGGHQSLGASGMVMGCLGLLAGQGGWREFGKAKPWRRGLATVGAGGLLFILLGVDPSSDVLAHLGGFLTGLVLAGLCRLKPDWTESPRLNVLAGMIFLGLVIGPWAVALSCQAVKTGAAPVSPG